MNFANPFALLLIPLFFILLSLFRGERRYVEYSSTANLNEVRGFGKILLRLPRRFLLFAILFASVAVARPQTSYQETEFVLQGREMILAIDTSFSMTGKAMQAIKNAVKDFAKKRVNDLIGITIYGTDAALIVLPTNEYSLIEKSVDRIDASQIGYRTAIGEGIFTSITALIEKEMGNKFEIRKIRDSINKRQLGEYALSLVREIGTQKNKLIILFTDGIYNVGIDPERPLRLAQRLGIRVHVITVNPSAETGVEPNQAAERIAALKKGAESTGGHYFEGEKYEDVQRFYNEVDKIEADKIVIETVSKKRDIFFYPAMASLFFLLGMIAVENIWLKIP
ncbi:MAG TPA: vWA domain-containing protein [Candidatus Brocadiia bacterium]|nr:VWA domain-containing protein [Planctomycetota bacterium]MDO8092836.1 VWA domain-containing protein [Candidatus Brocadiales bacterium]